MIYLTYNDHPSGIYSSQVTDVCSFLNKNFNLNIRLVALISIRDFSNNKRKIKQEFSSSLVLPMFPRPKNWRWNYMTLVLLFLFLGKQSVIARGPFAACLVLSLKKLKMVHKVCFDARGAYDAEFNEYNVADNRKINAEIFSIEKKAVINADFRISVSDKLITYWNVKFGYKNTKHVVIPCTISSSYFKADFDRNKIDAMKISLGYSESDIVFVYSGSLAKWQSIKLVDDFLCYQMTYNNSVKLLLLTNSVPDNLDVIKLYPNKVKVKWFNTEEVSDILSCCDYGLLIREISVTNSVASPVKFAEYLAAGLRIIISPGIGDYTDFVLRNNCGYVIGINHKEAILAKPMLSEKYSLKLLAKKNFSKESYFSQYASLYDGLI